MRTSSQLVREFTSSAFAKQGGEDQRALGQRILPGGGTKEFGQTRANRATSEGCKKNCGGRWESHAVAALAIRKVDSLRNCSIVTAINSFRRSPRFPDPSGQIILQTARPVWVMEGMK